MVELKFTKESIKELCPIALKLAQALCSDVETVDLDEHTLLTVPSDVYEDLVANAGNPADIDEIMEYLRVDPWASKWAEGICEVAVGRDSPYFDTCVDRMLKKLAIKIHEKMAGSESKE